MGGVFAATRLVTPRSGDVAQEDTRGRAATRPHPSLLRERPPLLGAGLGALLGLAATAPGDAKKKKKRKKNKGKQPTTTPPVTTPKPVARVDAACPLTGATSANPVRQAQTFRAIRSGKLTSASVYLVENLPGADLDVEIRTRQRSPRAVQQ